MSCASIHPEECPASGGRSSQSQPLWRVPADEQTSSMAAAEFRALPAELLSEKAWDTPCPLGPDDLLSGHFGSGMRYHAWLSPSDLCFTVI